MSYTGACVCLWFRSGQRLLDCSERVSAQNGKESSRFRHSILCNQLNERALTPLRYPTVLYPYSYKVLHVAATRFVRHPQSISKSASCFICFVSNCVFTPVQLFHLVTFKRLLFRPNCLPNSVGIQLCCFRAHLHCLELELLVQTQLWRHGSEHGRRWKPKHR